MLFRSRAAAVLVMAACSPSSKPPVTNDAAGDSGVDAGPPPPCSPFTVMLPIVSFTEAPVWTGSDYLVLSQQQPGVLQRIGNDGTLGATIQVGENMALTGTSVAWTGSTIGIVAKGATTRDLVRLKLDGSALGTTTIAPFSNLYDSMHIAWAGDRFVIAWMDMDAQTAYLEEFSADGVPGTAYSVRSASPDSASLIFNIVEAIATNASSYVMQLGNYGSATAVWIVIDRATGSMSHVVAPDKQYYQTNLVTRDSTSFAIYARSALIFRVLESTGLSAGTAVPGGSTFFDVERGATGYHVWSTQVDMTAKTATTSGLDMDLDGNLVSNPVAVTAYPTDQSYGLAGGVSRGNGYATAVEYGPNPNLTMRLVQECLP